MHPKSNNICPLKSEAEGNLMQWWGRGNVSTEAETGMVWPQPRNDYTNRSWERQRMDSPLEFLRRTWPCPHLDFRFPASRNSERISICCFTLSSVGLFLMASLENKCNKKIWLHIFMIYWVRARHSYSHFTYEEQSFWKIKWVAQDFSAGG